MSATPKSGAARGILALRRHTLPAAVLILTLLVACTSDIPAVRTATSVPSGELSATIQASDAFAPDSRQAATSVPLSSPILSAPSNPVTPLHAVLSLEVLPPVGQPATVSCQVLSDEDAPGTTAQIELPGNAHAVGGNLGWQGDLAANRSITFTASIVFDSGGDSALYCRTLRVVDADNTWGDLAALYLSVGPDQTSSGFATESPEPHDARSAVTPISAIGVPVPESTLPPR